jgi:hypothetical protein
MNLRAKSHDDRDLLILFLNYMIKKKFIEFSRMSQTMNNSVHKPEKLPPSRAAREPENESQLFDALPMTLSGGSGPIPKKTLENDSNNLSGIQTAGHIQPKLATSGLFQGKLGSSGSDPMPKSVHPPRSNLVQGLPNPYKSSDDNSELEILQGITNQLKKKATPSFVTPDEEQELIRQNPDMAKKLSVIREEESPGLGKSSDQRILDLERQVQHMRNVNVQLEQENDMLRDKAGQGLKGADLAKSHLDRALTDTNALTIENQKLRAKNKALLEENDLLNRQRNELMAGNEGGAGPGDQNLKQQILLLTEKMKDYRDKASIGENLNLEIQKLRAKNAALLNENDFLHKQKNELMMVGDHSRVLEQNEEGLKKQIAMLTDKMKEYRAKSKDAETLRLENEHLKIRAHAASTFESHNKNLGSEVEALRNEVQKLRVKNQALLAENEFINKQKAEMMLDQSQIAAEPQAVYKNQIEHLSHKVKEYRIKLKEMETILLESEGKKVELSKSLQQLNLSEHQA